MQTYGDWNYQQLRSFGHAVKEEDKTKKNVVLNKAQEDEKEEELTKAAIACAERAEQVDKRARLKQANKMASQRQKSEAETRYMIDEQLRQVGWEANTQEIRYSKGARPAKGRNMAIWLNREQIHRQQKRLRRLCVVCGDKTCWHYRGKSGT